jgi:hypothetical protein
MQTSVYLWYLAEFFLDCETFQAKVVDKIKARILFSLTFFRKAPLWDNVEK